MDTTTIRVPVKTRDALRTISKEKGISVQEATDRAVTLYRRQLMLEQANEAYERLRADPQVSHAFDNDPPNWDSTLNDGLEDY